MPFSKTQHYALQALIHLAQTPTSFRLNREVADQLDAPAPYLAKVLKRLALSGYLDSTKGRGGGYRIVKRGLRATVRDVARAADGRELLDGCVLGLLRCTAHAACPLHDRWMQVRDDATALLGAHTITELAAASRNGNSLLAPARLTSSTANAGASRAVKRVRKPAPH